MTLFFSSVLLKMLSMTVKSLTESFAKGILNDDDIYFLADNLLLKNISLKGSGSLKSIISTSFGNFFSNSKSVLVSVVSTSLGI